MKTTLFKWTTAAFLLAFTQISFATIDPGAPSAAHHFEEAAAELHEYLHHEHSNSYGSHGLENHGDALHGTLHDWVHGDATEADVVASKEALKLEWNTFRQTIIPAGVLNNSDATLDDLYDATKNAYKELRFLLRKAK